MSSLTESLRQVMAIEGVRGAALIDIATGMVVVAAGGPAEDSRRPRPGWPRKPG